VSGGVRWLIVGLVVLHGLIHGLGAAKGLGWATVPQLSDPIDPVAGVWWLAAGVAVLAAGVLVAVAAAEWWMVAGAAALLSQAVILTAWSDAKAGTAANAVLLLVAVYGFASYGPGSFEEQYRQRAAAALSDVASRPGGLVTDADLAGLPAPVAAYVRQSGAVGQPRVRSFAAEVHGRIRAGADKPWMPFTARQVNTYGASPQRLFLMRARMRGLPVAVFHAYGDATATMRGKLLSLVPVVDASGPEMDRGETVTVFNDLVVLAPAALVDAPIRWEQVDHRRVRGVFTNGDIEVAATLVFNDSHKLLDFVSDDRLRASTDGTSFTKQRWSTPLGRYRTLHGRTVATHGDGRWDAPEPEGEFTYVEFEVDDITYNPGTARSEASPQETAVPGWSPVSGRRRRKESSAAVGRA
jgi:CBS domain-containing protein